MIPILYEKTETTFTSNGLGRLPDAISCPVTEERNGEYELLLEYPITGLHYADLELERIIFAKPAPNKTPQPFVIYQIERPINGIVTIKAEHISYRLNKMVAAPLNATSASLAMAQIGGSIYGTHNFTFWTDKTTTANMHTEEPMQVREILGGTEGSILDVYGGEYEFDKFTVKLWAARGADNGVQIRYGKNITGINAETSTDNAITGAIAFWKDSDGVLVIGDMATHASSEYASQRTKVLDMSSDYDEQPTVAQLTSAANAYLNNNKPWDPDVTIEVEFVPLSKTPEYADFAALEDINLCDIVHVDYEPLGISVAAKVIRTVYNVLTDRYDEIEIGTAQRTNLSKVINDNNAELEQSIGNQATWTAEALENVRTWTEMEVENATDLITGGLGGYVLINRDANGKPFEILIMDTPDVQTAQNIWRWNSAGFGFSSSGYGGPYGTAITMDGQIVANYITAGILSGNIITAGKIQSVNGRVYFDLDNNELACSRLVEKTLYSANLVAEIQRNFNSSSYPHLAIYLSGVSSSEQYPIRLIPRFRSSPSGSGALVCEDGVEITTASSAAVTTDGQNIRLMTDSSSNKIIHVRTAYNSSNRAGIELRQATDGTSTIQLRSVSGTTIYNGDFYVRYNMQVTGNKNRRVKTEDYEDRLLYCYEMAEPVFGDFGSGVLDENGECVVEIDDIFAETITLNSEYHVFLQKEGQGDLWISEKSSRYFVVSGTPGLKFAWELKAKQWDGIATRLEAPDYDIQDRSGAVPEETYDQEIEQFIYEQEELLSEAAE